MIYDPSLNREQQMQAIVTALVTNRDELLKRVDETLKLNSLAQANRAVMYLQGPEYGQLLDQMRKLPKPLQLAVDAFSQEIQKCETRVKELFESKHKLRESVRNPVTIDVLVNQHKASTQLFLPVKDADLRYELVQALYDHCKREFGRYQTKTEFIEDRVSDYIVITADKALNKEGIHERVEAVPDALKDASVALRVVDEFCFPYKAAEQKAPKDKPHREPVRLDRPEPIKPTADKQAYTGRTAPARPAEPAQPEAPRTDAPPARASSYSNELKQYVYELRDQNLVADQIATKVKERFSVDLSRTNVISLLAWRNRPQKKEVR